MCECERGDMGYKHSNVRSRRRSTGGGGEAVFLPALSPPHGSVSPLCEWGAHCPPLGLPSGPSVDRVHLPELI